MWCAYLQQEIATVNLGKFRKLQHELEEAETRAMLAEKSLSQLRASRQSTTSVTESVSVSTVLYASCNVFSRVLSCSMFQRPPPPVLADEGTSLTVVARYP